MEEVKNNYNRKKGIKLIFSSLLIVPPSFCFYLVSMNSSELISKPLSIVILIIMVLFSILFVDGIIHVKKSKSEKKKNLRKIFKILIVVFFVLYIGLSSTFMGLLYVPGSPFKDWLITSAMTTQSHHYFATWFYNENEVDRSMAKNIVLETGEVTNPDLIDFTLPDFNQETYKNEYEKDVLTKEEGNELYKIINIDYDGVKGKLAVIYDASKVIIGTSKGMGTDVENNYGEFVYEMTKKYNAVIGTNASGFIDPNWNSKGGAPYGIVISQGELVANNEKANRGGGIIGFNKDNVLVLSQMTAEQALKAGIRDAVEYGPFLIVNGKSSYIKGNGGWGLAPRSVIGQRKDGIVLLLVVDGRQTSTMGADMNQLARIMWNYGAYNAANLDGGTSSSMVLNNKIITNPINGSWEPYTRPVPDAWLVLK